MKLMILTGVLIVSLVGCTSLVPGGRVFLDSTTHEDSAPSWVSSPKIGWDEHVSHFLHSRHTVRGNERVNGCYDLARFDAKETLLTEISEDIRGRLDQADQSISEAAEVILAKTRSGQFKGRISGLRFREEYFERYLINDTERIDCHVLSEISTADYNHVKRSVLNKVAEVDPRVRESITRRQIDFFSTEEQKKENRRTDYKLFFKNNSPGDKNTKVSDDKDVVDFQALQPIESATKELTAGNLDKVRDNLVHVAKAFLGVRYKFGGELENSGMLDCSAFSQKIYSVIGIPLPRTSPQQFDDPKAEKVTDKDQLMPGDLVFFDGFRGPGVVSHVGIVTGNDEFISANGNVGKVQMDKLSAPYWQKKYLGGRRVITDNNLKQNRSLAQAP